MAARSKRQRPVRDLRATEAMTTEQLHALAKRIWDVAAREFRRDATHRSKGCVIDACEAYFYASNLLGPKPRRDQLVHVVACINLAAESVGALERMRAEIAPR